MTLSVISEKASWKVSSVESFGKLPRFLKWRFMETSANKSL